MNVLDAVNTLSTKGVKVNVDFDRTTIWTTAAALTVAGVFVAIFYAFVKNRFRQA